MIQRRLDALVAGFCAGAIALAALAILGVPHVQSAAKFFEGFMPPARAASALVVLTMWLVVTSIIAWVLIMAGRDLFGQIQSHRRHELAERLGQVALGTVGFGLLALAVVHGQPVVHAGSIHEALSLVKP